MAISLGDTFTIEQAAHDAERVTPHALRGLHAPPLPVPPKLSASMGQLVFAVGRSVCSRTAPASVIETQKNASFAALGAICDLSQGSLRITNSLELLNETKRIAVAHDLGVGVASLIMQAMGYGWAGLTEDHLVPSKAKGFANRKRPDLLFDSGGGVSEYIALEAKGSTPRANAWVKDNLLRRLRTACKSQVANVLGAASADGGLISRGLASGFLGIPGGDDATFSVIEAKPPSSPSASPKSLSARVSFPDGDSPMAFNAMRHYLGVMRLIGAHHTGDQLLKKIFQLTEREAPFPEMVLSSPRLAGICDFRGHKFVVVDPMLLYPFYWSVPSPFYRFAISVDVLDFIQKQLLTIQPAETSQRFTVPTQEIRDLAGPALEDGPDGLVEYDGLALLPAEEIDFVDETTV